VSRNTRQCGVFNMVVSDLLEKGLEAFLNALKEPISSVDLYEQLELKSWSINWRYKSKRPTYQWHGLVTTVLNIEESPGEPLEPSGGWDLDLAMRNEEPYHEVFYMAYKLMEERRVPKGIVHDNLVEHVVLGQKVKVRSSALYFYGGNLPDESSECHWRISRWWHSYGDLPWCITRQNCPCDDCEKYRGAAKEEAARRLRKSRYTRLVNSFKNAVRENVNGRCQVCNESFDLRPPHTKRHSYRCIPLFGYDDELEDIGLDNFRAICSLCSRRGL